MEFTTGRVCTGRLRATRPWTKRVWAAPFRAGHPATLAAAAIFWATLGGPSVVFGANSPPLADTWNITSSGKAASSGELRFRVSDEAGDDAIEVTVFVLSGTNETGVASSIRRALTAQLNAQRFDVDAGEGANVQLSTDRDDRFSLELVDSDIDDVRVVVSSAAATPPPTVAPQQLPANPAAPATPRGPGDATPRDAGQAPGASAPPAGSSAPPGNASAPAAGASAPPADASAAPANPNAPPPNSSASPGNPSADPSGNPSSRPATPPSEGQAPDPSAPTPARPASPPENASAPAPPGGSHTANGGAGAPASAPPPPVASPRGS